MSKIIIPSIAVLAFTMAGIFAADPTPGTENDWSIELQGFCAKGTAPFFIYARESNGQWLAAVVSSRRRYNTAWHAVDLAKLPIKDGKLKGAVTINIVPDTWVPSNHESFPIVVELDATSPKPGTMEGTWKITSVGSTDGSGENFGKKGKLVATSKPEPAQTLSDKVTFTMNMPGSVIGGDPKYGERAMSLIVGCEDGKGVAGMWAGVMGSATPFPIEADTVRYGSHSLRGKCSYPSKTLDGEDANYVVEFDCSILSDLLAGRYTATISVAGRPAVVKRGGFEGKRSAGINMPAFDPRPWWSPAKNFKEVQAGEHPRLLFRESDLPMLRKRAKTPEGKAILAHLRLTLDGKNGDTMPVAYNPEVGPVNEDGGGPFPAKAPMGSFTIGHVAGYGLLYQVTGEKKYADLGKQCFEKAMAGYRDVDRRYSFQGPENPFRGGTALAWMAVGFDLCYDGWDTATRKRAAEAIGDYKGILRIGQPPVTLENLVRGTMPPFSNHYGPMVGGGAMALLAVVKEPGVDQARIKKLLGAAESSMRRNLTEGFGDGGFFAEGDGTGSMSSQLSFLSALQAWRSVLGRDYINVERPNARMLTLKWIYLTVVRGGKPDFWPVRGAYGHNVWARGGLSGAGYFAIGIANVTDEQRAAMKWYYNKFLLAPDTEAGVPYDTVGRYPHFSVCSFINWPFEMKERNPAEVLPLCYRDSIKGFYAWRNRWQDENDIVISTLLSQTQGYMKARADGGLSIAAFGKKISWGRIRGGTKYWWSSPRGHASVLTVDDGTTTGIDFTRAGGVDALLVTTSIVEGNQVDQQMKLGNTTLYFLFLTADGKKPTVSVKDDKAVIGKQTVTLNDGNICFGVTAP